MALPSVLMHIIEKQGRHHIIAAGKRTRGQTMTGMAYEINLELSFEQALDVVVAALKAEGFGVLTRIDVHDAFKE
jgi:hypothetical protein